LKVGEAIRLLQEKKEDWASKYVAGTLLNSLDKAVRAGIVSVNDDVSTLVRRVSSEGG